MHFVLKKEKKTPPGRVVYIFSSRSCNFVLTCTHSVKVLNRVIPG